jgi:hypothetical protein
VTGGAQHLRYGLGALGVLVQHRDVADRRGSAQDHLVTPSVWLGFLRSTLVKSPTIERTAARAIGFTR